jgi:hypothetical protein
MVRKNVLVKYGKMTELGANMSYGQNCSDTLFEWCFLAHIWHTPQITAVATFNIATLQ